MKKLLNLIYTGSSGRTSLYDLFLTDVPNKKPLVVFMHGYMGYKDWGCWNLMGEEFVKQGYSFAKFTITHSGTTVNEPKTFVDLEAFGKGGYLKELHDLQFFLNHLEKEHAFREFILVGHSRGGGTIVLGGNDARVRQIHCLGPICDIASRFPKAEKMKAWKQTKVYFYRNSRANIDLPHYFSQYEDFIQHHEELTIELQAKKLNKPVFVYHGSDDTSVEPCEGRLIAQWTNGQFFLIEDTAHTFDSKEPWAEGYLPKKFKCMLDVLFQNLNSTMEF